MGFAGAVLAILLAIPPMAVASNVGMVSGPEIHYEARDGESNVLSTSRVAADFYFREGTPQRPGVSITPDLPCGLLPQPAPDNYLARCPAVDDSGSPVVRVTVSLLDKDDHLTVTSSATPYQPPPPSESFLLKALGGSGDDNLEGGAGNDDLQGGNGDDSLAGRAGNDDLQGEGGSDALSGGEGTDTADFGNRTERLTIDLDGDKDDGESDERDNVQPDVERLIGGSNSDTLTGSSAANFLDGGAEEDTIEGRGGDDTLEGGKDEAGDTLRGENGRDTLRGGQGEDSLTGGEDDDRLTGGGGADDMDGDRGGDKVEGGPGGDALDGGEGDDSLYGGALGGVVGADGDDRLNGGRGADLLFGGRGNDLLDGGTEGDTMSGEAGKDTVTYDDRTNPVRVSLNGIADDGEKGEGDNVADDVEVIDGGERDDTLSGDADRNLLNGGPGDDEIQANDGSDQLTGGKASDLLEARDGNSDVVDCEDDKDLAIADRDDAVRNCETVDRPGARQPIVGRYARVRQEGEYGLRLPQGRRFFSLTQNVKIPMGSTVDPKADDVRLVTARNRKGGRQVASVSAGRFAVRQSGRRPPVTELRLAGKRPSCRGSSTRQGRVSRAARSSARRLRVDVGGPASSPKVSNRAGVSRALRRRSRRARVSVRGRYSLGGSVGTKWVTEDRCDGTLTTVISGTVHVQDFGRGRTVTVRPGKPYLARADN
jgi:hypothetical protein